MAVARLQMKYFVLKPEGDDAYARASRDAMRAYAIAIRHTNKELSEDLMEWANAEQDKIGGLKISID